MTRYLFYFVVVFTAALLALATVTVARAEGFSAPVETAEQSIARHTPPAPAPVVSSAGAYGLSPYLTRVAMCESRLNPRAVGQLGEVGLFQLHPRGLLPLFYQRGFTNAWDGWQQAAFATWAFANGLGSHWSCR